MPVTVNDAKLKKSTVDDVKCKIITVNGTKVWSAEEARADLAASVYNYHESGNTASAKSATVWDLRGFDSVALSWSLVTEMAWPNEYGVRSTTRVYLHLADGTTVPLGSKTETLFVAGSVYEAGGKATVDLSGYTDAQLSSVQLYLTLGDMSAGAPIGNADRHNASASITGALAS